jgi:hypothetical protein
VSPSWGLLGEIWTLIAAGLGWARRPRRRALRRRAIRDDRRRFANHRRRRARKIMGDIGVRIEGKS